MSTSALDHFQVIADPSRRHILHLLSDKRLTINALAENFEMSRPAVSKHIKLLHETGFITIEDSGRERYCVLREEGFAEIRQWISYFDKFWVRKMKKLEAVMNQPKKRVSHPVKVRR